jgi:hypothetical protein
LYGWTPRTFTRHSYDGKGRLSESVSWTETRWPAGEVALLLASRRENVGPHGVPMDEAMNPDNANKFVVKANRDYAQMAVSAMRRDYEKKYPHEDLSAFMFRAELPEPTDE